MASENVEEQLGEGKGPLTRRRMSAKSSAINIQIAMKSNDLVFLQEIYTDLCFGRGLGNSENARQLRCRIAALVLSSIKSLLRKQDMSGAKRILEEIEASDLLRAICEIEPEYEQVRAIAAGEAKRTDILKVLRPEKPGEPHLGGGKQGEPHLGGGKNLRPGKEPQKNLSQILDQPLDGQSLKHALHGELMEASDAVAPRITTLRGEFMRLEAGAVVREQGLLSELTRASRAAREAEQVLHEGVMLRNQGGTSQRLLRERLEQVEKEAREGLAALRDARSTAADARKAEFDIRLERDTLRDELATAQRGLKSGELQGSQAEKLAQARDSAEHEARRALQDAQELERRLRGEIASEQAELQAERAELRLSTNSRLTAESAEDTESNRGRAGSIMVPQSRLRVHSAGDAESNRAGAGSIQLHLPPKKTVSFAQESSPSPQGNLEAEFEEARNSAAESRRAELEMKLERDEVSQDLATLRNAFAETSAVAERCGKEETLFRGQLDEARSELASLKATMA